MSDKSTSEDVELSTCVADTEFMLRKANEHIEKLNCELKEKEYSLQYMCSKASFYEQIVKNLTTFK